MAYSAAHAVFLQVEESKVTIQLLASRARVAPSSKTKGGLTIPRLELLAASIGTRLWKTVVDDFKLQRTRTIFWTDTTTVLACIRRNEPWNVFIMNRSKEIRALSEACEWRHVPGEINADCRWWEGHTWLYEDPEHWPQHEEQLHEHEVNAEKRKTVVSAISLQSSPAPGKWYAYFSRFTKLVRMIGWMQRFIFNLKYNNF